MFRSNTTIRRLITVGTAVALFVTLAIPAGAQEVGSEPVTVRYHEEYFVGSSVGAQDLFESFEQAWRRDHTILEAAMIINSASRGYFSAVPADSGEGRRVVYSKSDQAVWLISDDGHVIDSYFVSGQNRLPRPGNWAVYSKSEKTRGYDPSYTMNWMVRFARGKVGRIGFHDLPLKNGKPVQTEDELGLALSGGCVRQDGYHARMLYAWADIGTPVIVLP